MKSAKPIDTNLLVAVRISAASNLKRRPSWFTKDVCVRSIVNAVKEFRAHGGSVRTVLLVDLKSGMHLGDAHLEYGDSFDQIIGLRGGSAARSWRASIRALRRSELLESSQLLYFVEDDHLHEVHSLIRLMQGTADYRFVYASDEDLPVATTGSLSEGAVQAWEAVESGVTSFAATSHIFRKDAWKHVILSYGGRGWDELVFRGLGLGARRILGQGWRYTVAPLRQIGSPRQSLGSLRHALFRAGAQILGWFAPRRTVEAMMPVGAAHAEVDKLPGGIDWVQVARSVSVTDTNPVASK